MCYNEGKKKKDASFPALMGQRTIRKGVVLDAAHGRHKEQHEKRGISGAAYASRGDKSAQVRGQGSVQAVKLCGIGRFDL